MSLVRSDEEQRWVPTHVQVTVLRARGLRAKGKHGTSDVYTIIQLGKEKYSTCVMEKTTDPEWGEECSFELQPGILEEGGRDAYPPGSGDLTLTVMHRALIGLDVFLGQAVISLDKAFQDRICKKNQWYQLHSKTGKKEKERGELQLNVQFTRHNLTANHTVAPSPQVSPVRHMYTNEMCDFSLPVPHPVTSEKDTLILLPSVCLNGNPVETSPLTHHPPSIILQQPKLESTKPETQSGQPQASELPTQPKKTQPKEPKSQTSTEIKLSKTESKPRPEPQLSALGLIQKGSTLSRSLQNLSPRGEEKQNGGPADGRRWSFDKPGEEEKAAIVAALECAGRVTDESVMETVKPVGEIETQSKKRRGLFSHGKGESPGKGPIRSKEEAEHAQQLVEVKHKGWFSSKDSHSKPSPHPVKPLTPPDDKKSEGRSVLDKLKSTIHSGRSHHSDQEADKKLLVEGGGSYYHLNHSELVNLLIQRDTELKREREEFERRGALLEKREMEVRKMKVVIKDLEDYIDTLLVRIMEQTPMLLQVRSRMK